MNPAEAYILNQPEPYKSMLLQLQVLIESSIDKAELVYKWKIPCYYINKKPFCYLNASHKKGFVDVGFWHSAYLTKYEPYFSKEKRKVVRSLRYTTIEDINEKILIEILLEAEKHQGKSFYK